MVKNDPFPTCLCTFPSLPAAGNRTACRRGARRLKGGHAKGANGGSPRLPLYSRGDKCYIIWNSLSRQEMMRQGMTAEPAKSPVAREMSMKYVLTIAGHDLSSGAGITKDLEVFSARRTIGTFFTPFTRTIGTSYIPPVKHKVRS